MKEFWVLKIILKSNSKALIRPFDLKNDTLIRVGFIEENDIINWYT